MFTVPVHSASHSDVFSDWFKSENSQKFRHRILLYDNCFLIGLSPRIPRNPGTEFSCMRAAL